MTTYWIVTNELSLCRCEMELPIWGETKKLFSDNRSCYEGARQLDMPGYSTYYAFFERKDAIKYISFVVKRDLEFLEQDNQRRLTKKAQLEKAEEFLAANAK
jgi:hypothetical protein